MRVVLAVLLLGLLAGCSGSATELSAESPEPRAGGAAVACDPQAPAPGPPEADVDLTVKPVIEIPDAAPPCRLVTRDLVVGAGPIAEPGRTTTVKYVGVTYADGTEFDASWGKDDFDFLLGGGEVIAGWDQGIAGMRVGGRRELVVPPDLGYGERGAGGGVIPPNATLVFVVDLVSVA